MIDLYKIICDGSSLEDISLQIRAIKIFPAVIQIYDRTFRLSNIDEAYVLINGVETGWYMREELFEKELKRSNVVKIRVAAGN